MGRLDAGVFRVAAVSDLLVHLRQGDVPDNAKNLYESLQTAASRPLQRAIRRDRGSATGPTANFCNGGKRFDAILSELEARRIGGIMLHDARRAPMPRKSR